MEITSAKVKELRDKTGAGMMDCKEALRVANGDFEKAIDHLRQKGMSAATKRSSKTTKEGVVASYIHMGGKIGVLVELNCETDFVAKTEQFRGLAKDIAMHIAAANPLFLNSEEIPEATRERERAIYIEQAKAENKPEKISEKIIEGKFKKYYEDVCLLEQRFVKDTDKMVSQLITEMIANTGENIVLRRFARFQLGETSQG